MRPASRVACLCPGGAGLCPRQFLYLGFFGLQPASDLREQLSNLIWASRGWQCGAQRSCWPRSPAGGVRDKPAASRACPRGRRCGRGGVRRCLPLRPRCGKAVRPCRADIEIHSAQRCMVVRWRVIRCLPRSVHCGWQTAGKWRLARPAACGHRRCRPHRYGACGCRRGSRPGRRSARA